MKYTNIKVVNKVEWGGVRGVALTTGVGVLDKQVDTRCKHDDALAIYEVLAMRSIQPGTTWRSCWTTRVDTMMPL